MHAVYRKSPQCALSKLCDKYGSDKGSLTSAGHAYSWPAHTYTDFYSQIWSHCRYSVRRVFECGLGTNNTSVPSNMGALGKPGASLRVWRDYFPNAEIVGADVDKSVLFQESRISTFHVDQLDPHLIRRMWDAVGDPGFDFMIDDGLHTFQAGVTLFENSISRLIPNGIYVIEDVGAGDLARYFDYFSDSKYHAIFVSLHRPGLPVIDNSLVCIRNAL
jgi:hypothetical protein